MKERLIKILEYKSLSSAQFADIIGVQRSSISHIISGRNKPSYDFLVKILDKFSDINAEWLITGNGDMLKSHKTAAMTSNNQGEDLFSQQNDKSKENPPAKEPYTSYNKVNKEESAFETDKKQPQTPEVTNVNNVKKIIFIYEDDTFEVIHKR